MDILEPENRPEVPRPVIGTNPLVDMVESPMVRMRPNRPGFSPMRFPVEAKWQGGCDAVMLARTKRTPRPRRRRFVCPKKLFRIPCPTNLTRPAPPPASGASLPANAVSSDSPLSPAGSRCSRASNCAARARGCARWLWMNSRSAPPILCRFAGCARWYAGPARRNAASKRPPITGPARPPACAPRRPATRSPRIPGIPPQPETGGCPVGRPMAISMARRP